MSKAAPKVTVLMPVYNAAAFLPDAVESILGQSLTDFEFLIVEDGSTDASFELLQNYRDPRIRLVPNGANLGLIASLNRGLDLARGEYVARMDADDISLPERLERQVSFLDAHREVALCGSWVDAFEGADSTLWAVPSTDAEIKANLLFESVVYHPTVMMRRTLVADPSLRYDPAYPHAEDYEFWCRLASSCQFANITAVLLRYRLHQESVSQRNRELQARSAGRIQARVLGELGIAPTAGELELHGAVSRWRIPADRHFLQAAHRWFLKLQRANQERALVPQLCFDRMLAKRWYQICFIATGTGIDAWRQFYRSPLSRHVHLSLRERGVFLVRALLRARN